MTETLTEKPDSQPLDQIIGAAVKSERIHAGMTLAQLSSKASVSTAMISKIERGQVSASLSTLGALAQAIGVPLINFFAGTVERADVSFVAAGEGVTVQRQGSAFGQTYKMIGRADADHVKMESFTVTLEQPLGNRPVYQHRGAEFIHMVSGEMTYRCGEHSYRMRAGDSLSFDSSTAHGPVELHSKQVTFLVVASHSA
ncbi:MAG: helix-turn-helix domain-containing protein [Rhodobacteraceae bacterium]|nr:helix-turn-helix domain-containing protein [Paracoccaceae bacterium]